MRRDTDRPLAAALALFFVPFFGHLSDRIGRKRMYIMAGAVVTIIATLLLPDPGRA